MNVTGQTTLGRQTKNERSGGRGVAAVATIWVGTIVLAIAVALFASESLGLGQRGSTSNANPLLARSAIEFRASEHGGFATADPLLARSAIEFRASEDEGFATADPLLARSAIEFRASEHGGQ